MPRIFQNGSWFGKFKRLHLFFLTSYGLITGLADFPFTEQCYWYLQSALNCCLKAAPLSVEKPNFPDFLFLLLIFLSFFHLSSLRRAIPVLSEPLELVSSQFFSAWVEDVQRQGQKKKEDIFCWWISWLWQPWLCGLTPFKLLLTWYAWIQLSIVTMLCCKLMVQIESLHKKGAHDQCNSAAN